MKLTKRKWIEDVIKFLNVHKDDDTAKALIDDYITLEITAEKKRESARRRKMMRTIEKTETVKVNKDNKEKALQLLSEAQKLLQ